MSSDPFSHDPRSLDWVLADFVRRVPHTRAAVLASSDGVLKHRHGLGADDADRLSAIATGLCSLARGVGVLAGDSEGAVRQVVVEHDAGLLFVSAAGQRAVLAVWAGQEADPGVVGYEMAQLVKSIPEHLATPVRPGTPLPGDAGA